MLVAAIALLLPLQAVAPASGYSIGTHLSFVGNHRILVAGDSTTVELCSHEPTKAWGQLVGNALGMPVDNVGIPGLQTVQIPTMETGSATDPRYPPKVARDYSVMLTGTMINETQQFYHYMGQYGITIPHQIQLYQQTFDGLRLLEPSAPIINFGLRDLVQNAYPAPENGSFTPAQATLFRKAEADYVAAASSYMESRPNMAYLSIFPATPQYYAQPDNSQFYQKDMICGPAHPDLKSEPYIAYQVLLLLQGLGYPIPASAYAYIKSLET